MPYIILLTLTLSACTVPRGTDPDADPIEDPLTECQQMVNQLRMRLSLCHYDEKKTDRR